MESKVLFRTFIAVPLEVPPVLQETRTFLKKEFRDERIRWVDPGQMHITFWFLGDTGQEAVEVVKARFVEAYEPFAAAPLRLQGLGTFSHRSELKVLWAGIRETEFLEELYAATQRMLEGVVPRDENKSFRPHLTLARMKRLRDPDRFRHVTARFKDLELGECDVKEVVFYRSILQPAGAMYERLVSVDL